MIFVKVKHAFLVNFTVVLLSVTVNAQVFVKAFLDVNCRHPLQLVNMDIDQVNLRAVVSFLKYQNQSIL